LAARSLEVVDRHELEPGGAPAAHDLLHRGGALMAPRVDPARRAAVVEEQDLAAAEARAGALDDGGGAGALRVPQAARPADEREAAAPQRAAEERPLEAVRRAQERRRLDARGADRRRPAVELLGDDPRRREVELPVRVAVERDEVAAPVDLADEVRPRERRLAQDEERGARAGAVERLEHRRRVR